MSDELIHKLQELADHLLTMLEALPSSNKSSGDEAEGGTETNDEDNHLAEDLSTLIQLTKDPSVQATFPVYGAMKAGKSTFLACLIGEKLLPEQTQPMTSIPIRIMHVGSMEQGERILVIPQHDKWNNAVAGFKEKLERRELRNLLKDDGTVLYKMQELIRSKAVNFEGKYSDSSEKIRAALDNLTHFVRLLWINNIDFEKDFGISLDVALLPTIEVCMKAFASLPQGQSFSLLDTPGPNEQQAFETLEKMGPKIMRTASGCILCMPPSSLASTDAWKIFEFINKTMKNGKKVIGLLTQWDTMKGGDADEHDTFEKFNELLNPVVLENTTVHKISGHKLFLVFRLTAFLRRHASLSESEFYDTLRQLKDSPNNDEVDFCRDLKSYQPDEVTGWRRDSLIRLAIQTFEELHSAAIIASFRALYEDSKNLALQGHVASIRDIHSRWSAAVKDLEKFKNENAEERAKSQRLLENINDVYMDVDSKLSALGSGLRDTVKNKVEEILKRYLDDAQQNMKGWQVVELHYRNGREERVEKRIITFEGGLPGMMRWFTEEAHPKLLPHVQQPTEKAIAEVVKTVPDVILESFQLCHSLVQKLKDMGSEGFDDLLLFLHQRPILDINPKSYIDRSCQFDVKSITFIRHPDRCEIDNEIFKVDVYKQFEKQFSQVLPSVTTLFLADLEGHFENFGAKIKAEKENAQAIFIRNKKIMEQNLKAADLADTLEHCASLDIDFQTKLSRLSANLSAAKSSKVAGIDDWWNDSPLSSPGSVNETGTSSAGPDGKWRSERDEKEAGREDGNAGPAAGSASASPATPSRRSDKFKAPPLPPSFRDTFKSDRDRDRDAAEPNNCR